MLAGILRATLQVLNLLGLVDLRSLLALHIIILSLSVLARNLGHVVILLHISLVLFELCLGLALRIVVQGMQIISTHLLLDITRHIIVLELSASAMRHGHILKHLLLSNGYMTSHCP